MLAKLVTKEGCIRVLEMRDFRPEIYLAKIEPVRLGNCEGGLVDLCPLDKTCFKYINTNDLGTLIYEEE